MDQRIEKQQQRTNKKNFKTTAALEYQTYFNILPLKKKMLSFTTKCLILKFRSVFQIS